MTSTECCLPLLLPVTARSISLGQALTARSGADAIFYNPASLAGVGKDEFVIHHQATFEGQDIAITVAIDAGLAGSFGLTYVLMDKGQSDATSEGGQVTGTVAVRYHQLIASYATPVTAGLRAGVS